MEKTGKLILRKHQNDNASWLQAPGRNAGKDNQVSQERIKN